jgi:hypothetical protein
MEVKSVIVQKSEEEEVFWIQTPGSFSTIGTERSSALESSS